MPNQPRADNRVRGFRIPDTVYLAAQKRAAERGEPLTAVVHRALVDYVDCPDCGHPPAADAHREACG